ncbi:MAG: hypothetical protein IJ443_02605 [Firmicutes bacterium]|nr:hypothetical protein [Bacillota bacterium]
MSGIVTGTAAFGLLLIYEYQKCRSIRQNLSRRNPWFLLGTLVLLGTFLMEALDAETADWPRFTAGVIVLAVGILIYGAVLGVAVGGQGYTRDRSVTEVSRKGLYGHMRHPGVWSFLLCSLGYGTAFPEGMAMALWMAVLNLFYTILQDRYFFPVYLAGYEKYKKEVPFLFPRLKQPPSCERERERGNRKN